MAFINPGSDLPIATTFNSGKVDFGAGNLAEVTSISITIGRNAVSYHTLNKRVKSKNKAGNETHSLSFDIEGGIYETIIAKYFGASSPVTGGLDYSSINTQPVQPAIFITVYENDDITKPIQFQAQNPVITDISPAIEQENFGKMTVTVECTEIVVFVDTDVS